MGIILFDWKSSSTTKKVVKPLFTRLSLFDGYLTEPTSYQQLPQKSLFDWKNTSTTKEDLVFGDKCDALGKSQESQESQEKEQ